MPRVLMPRKNFARKLIVRVILLTTLIRDLMKAGNRWLLAEDSVGFFCCRPEGELLPVFHGCVAGSVFRRVASVFRSLFGRS